MRKCFPRVSPIASPSVFCIEPLGASHKKLREAFLCSEPALDRYLKQNARQDMESGTALPFVCIADGRFAGYYTLSSYGIRSDDFPPEQLKQLRLPRYDVISATLLGRLAVDLTFQGKGLGEMLLLDAMKKALDGSRTFAASTGLAVEAKNDNAQRFYGKYGFSSPFPDTPQHLFMRMETIAELLDQFFPLRHLPTQSKGKGAPAMIELLIHASPRRCTQTPNPTRSRPSNLELFRTTPPACT